MSRARLLALLVCLVGCNQEVTPVPEYDSAQFQDGAALGDAAQPPDGAPPPPQDSSGMDLDGGSDGGLDGGGPDADDADAGTPDA